MARLRRWRNTGNMGREEPQMPAGGGFIGGRPAVPGRGDPSLALRMTDPALRMTDPTGGMTGPVAGNPVMQMPGMMPQEPGNQEGIGIIDQLQNANSDSVAEARELGMRMGVEQAMEDEGISPMRIRRLQEESRLMNPQRLRKATETLLKYQAGKNSVDRRVQEAQQWWKLNNWEEQMKERGTKGASLKKSNTGWLWNSIVGKHADAIESYPEPIILPRAEDDKDEAKKLTKILPVVMEINGFEKVYNNAMWQKMQEGTGVYGIFWDPDKMNGLGDISIKNINILNLHWEPGVDDIQDSRNLFYTHYEDIEELVQEHPELEGQISGRGSSFTQKEYKTDDNINRDGKIAVIDWYYKKREGGRTVLHFCQYVNDIALYSTEENGITMYDHGMYPFVMDPLFPVAGSPAGYGYIDIGKDTQMDIDTISQAITKNTEWGSTPRYMMRKDGGINEQEFGDASKPIVHVSGMLGKDSYIAIECPPLPGSALSMLQQKIDELKYITGNTDVKNGGVPSGVTAASAIAALQEENGRTDKDSNRAAYRAYREIVNMLIELIRQFYDIPRQFRIIGRNEAEEFTSFDNSGLIPQEISNGMIAESGLRMPVFDIEVRAQRENAYTKMSQNELAIQMYQLGVFNPQMTDQALMLLDAMDFRGKDEMRQRVEQNGTIQDALMQVGQIAMALAQKYDPAVAQQLGMVMQGMVADAGMAPAGGETNPNEITSAPKDNMSAENPNENKIVSRARERAANASRPA